MDKRRLARATFLAFRPIRLTENIPWWVQLMPAPFFAVLSFGASTLASLPMSWRVGIAMAVMLACAVWACYRLLSELEAGPRLRVDARTHWMHVDDGQGVFVGGAFVKVGMLPAGNPLSRVVSVQC